MSIVKKAFVTIKNAFIEFWRHFGWFVVWVLGVTFGLVITVCHFEYPQFTNPYVFLLVILISLIYYLSFAVSGTILFLLIGLIKDKWSRVRPENR